MLEFVKTILESNKKEDGTIDISKAMVEINKEAPKNIVPKATFNEKLDDLKTANKLVDDLKKDNKDVEQLQSKITQYETDINTLKAERIAERKTNAIKEKLKESGAKDVDYMIFKLGDLEADEEGIVKDLDNKVKTLIEGNKDHFTIEEAPAEPPGAGTKGFKVLDNKLEDGKDPDAVQQATAEFEQALGLQTH